MNTEFHFDFTTIDDEFHRLEFLLGGMSKVYREFESSGGKGQLWNLAVAVTSDITGRQAEEKIDHGLFISSLKQLIEEAWVVLQMRNDVHFQHQYLSMIWERNPYAMQTNLIGRDCSYGSSYLRQHAGQVTVLTVTETRNFFLVFEDFFQQLDVVRWTKLLDLWLKFAESDEGITSHGFDYTPLETYKQLLRLVEACYLADKFRTEPNFYPPYQELFDREYVMLELEVDIYDSYNPFLQLSWIFIERTLPEMRNLLAHWMDCAKHKEKIYTQNEPATLILFYSDMCKLLEIGWLILHTAETPKHWLNRDQFDPDENQNLVNTNEEKYLSLSKNARQFPNKALKNFYSKHLWFHDLRENLKNALYYALHTKAEYHNIDVFDELEESIGMLMEILYLINREFHLGSETKN